MKSRVTPLPAFATNILPTMPIEIAQLSVEHHHSGFGISNPSPRLSWRFPSRLQPTRGGSRPRTRPEEGSRATLARLNHPARHDILRFPVQKVLCQLETAGIQNADHSYGPPMVRRGCCSTGSKRWSRAASTTSRSSMRPTPHGRRSPTRASMASMCLLSSWNETRLPYHRVSGFCGARCLDGFPGEATQSGATAWIKLMSAMASPSSGNGG